MGKLATNSDIPWCKENEMKWGWHEKGFCGKQLGATRPDELRRFDRDLGRWTVPGIGIAKESDKSVEDILGPGLSLLEKGEQVLYKLTETWNFYGRYDDMIVTDKQIITVDEKLAKGKKQYSTFAYPPGMDFDLIWKNMYSWEIHTAKRTGTKRSWNSIDAHIGIHVTARSFHFDLDKTAVPTSKLFEYHTKLQNKVAAASQYFR